MEPKGWIAQSPRVVLRPVAPEDAAATAALISPAVSARLLSWPSPMSRDEARERILRSQRDSAAGLGLDVAIFLRPSLRLVGWIGLRRGERPGEATLGFWLSEAFQGSGLMKEAAAAALPELARLLDIGFVRAAVQPGNARSIAILHGLGFLFAGTGTAESPVRERSEHLLWYEGRFGRPRSLAPGPDQLSAVPDLNTR